ncbi:MAG: hypothetical protein MUO67_10030 [Anaerolineales bacterium]|nr:hypothetical protein [Anaerolineales bacterium]
MRIVRAVNGKVYRNTATVSTTIVRELGPEVDRGANREDARCACVGNACDPQHIVRVELPEATRVASNDHRAMSIRHAHLGGGIAAYLGSGIARPRSLRVPSTQGDTLVCQGVMSDQVVLT